MTGAMKFIMNSVYPKIISVILSLVLCVSAVSPGVLCAYADDGETPTVSDAPETSTAPSSSPAPESSVEPSPVPETSAEPSSAPAPESSVEPSPVPPPDNEGEDEGGTEPTRREALLARIENLPSADTLSGMTAEELEALNAEIDAIYGELDALLLSGEIGEEEYVSVSASLSALGSAVSSAFRGTDEGADVTDIADADALIALLSSTDTVGRQYSLTSDITLSSTDIPANSCFAGQLNGNGKTIRISGSSPSLFASLGESAEAPAGLYNFNLVFEGDVLGAPLAAEAVFADIIAVNVSVGGNILFAESGSLAYASGLFGYCAAGGEVNAENLQITCAGMIGSAEGKSNQYLLASGIYNDIAGENISVSLCNIGVSAGVISAVSTYALEDGVVCASGAVSGYAGVSAALEEVSVLVGKDIHAVRAPGGAASVGAYGLGYMLSSISFCAVDVKGSIVAEDSISETADVSSVSESGITACALAYRCAPGDGANTVKVGGDVSALNYSAAFAPVRVVSSGGVYWSDPTSAWNGTSVTVGGTIYAHAVNDAVAVGFMVNELDSPSAFTAYDLAPTPDFELISCSVSAGNILSESEGSLASAAGFAYNGYSRFKDCTVTLTGDISAYGKTAVSAGFTVFAIPSRENSSGVCVMCDGCTVSANAILASAARADDVGLANSAAGGFAYSLSASELASEIRNCRVNLGSISAPATENAALFACINAGGANLNGNGVSLSFDAKHLVTIDTLNYVRFTAFENEGRAAASDWASGNTVTLSGTARHVLCRFDSGAKPDSLPAENALWLLSEQYSVSFDANGHGEAPEVQLVLHGETVSEPEAPTAPGYDFMGWYTDADCKTAFSFDTPVTASMTLYAKWQTSESANYTVEHYIEAVERDAEGNAQYTLEKTETKSAPRGSVVTAAPLSFADHHVDASVDGTVPSGTVLADGSLVLKLYYPYDTVKYTYNLAGGTGDESGYYGIIEVRKGDTVTLEKAPTRDNYTFSSWKLGTKSYAPGDTVAIERASVFTASWSSLSPVESPSPSPSASPIPSVSPTPRPSATPRPIQTARPSASVATGDASNLVLWASLLGVSAVCAAAAVFVIIKKRKK